MYLEYTTKFIRFALGLTREFKMEQIVHSGDVGDIIYSLPAISKLGLNTILLNIGKRVETYFNIKTATALAPLLSHLGFTTSITRFEGSIPPDIFDGDRFRYDGSNLSSIHLAEAITMSYGTEVDLKNPWIPPSETPFKNGGYVAVCRSPRYHGVEIDYSTLFDMIPSGYDIYFLGLPSEYRLFTKSMNHFSLNSNRSLKHVRTADFLQVYNVLSGADLVIGNQTGVFSIAEALKKPRILEVSEFVRNCKLKDPDDNIFYFYSSNDYEDCAEFIYYKKEFL